MLKHSEYTCNLYCARITMSTFCLFCHSRLRITWTNGDRSWGSAHLNLLTLRKAPIITIILQYSQRKLTCKNSLLTFYRCSETNNIQAPKHLHKILHECQFMIHFKNCLSAQIKKIKTKILLEESQVI